MTNIILSEIKEAISKIKANRAPEGDGIVIDQIEVKIFLIYAYKKSKTQ